MSDSAAPASAFRPKKSVALSGVAAGNTALCTVGRSGNDLHYRGYNILDVATACEFEEIAFLLVHGKLPNRGELAAYKLKLQGLRGLPGAVAVVLEQLPAGCHPMDDEGGCYEPGEYCRDDDRGTAGRAGDGDTITCEEESRGWFWESP